MDREETKTFIIFFAIIKPDQKRRKALHSLHNSRPSGKAEYSGTSGYIRFRLHTLQVTDSANPEIVLQVKNFASG